MIEYLIVFVLLFILMLAYFRIADRYNIIDKPNHRSAHTEITLRGGGIVYPLAFVLFICSLFIITENEATLIARRSYLIFGVGLLTICAISFIDDIVDLSSKIRLVFHFISVTLLLYFLGLFQILPVWAIPVIYIVVIGILNACNFMDGINGMSGLYNLVALGTLLYVNQKVTTFTDEDFIIYPIIACLVFLFFNFRKKAKCFMGDVGSFGVAFWVLALIGLLIIKTNDFKWIMLLTVYGVEAVLTIIERVKLKENIMEAHRRHLYQLFANDKKVPHLVVSTGYAICQIIINILLIVLQLPDWLMFIIIIMPTAVLYLLVKMNIKKQLGEKLFLQ